MKQVEEKTCLVFRETKGRWYKTLLIRYRTIKETKIHDIRRQDKSWHDESKNDTKYKTRHYKTNRVK